MAGEETGGGGGEWGRWRRVGEVEESGRGGGARSARENFARFCSLRSQNLAKSSRALPIQKVAVSVCTCTIVDVR